MICNYGIDGTGNVEKTDKIAPHWYVPPDYFYQNSDIFDKYPRGKHMVYVGEYACNVGFNPWETQVEYKDITLNIGGKTPKRGFSLPPFEAYGEQGFMYNIKIIVTPHKIYPQESEFNNFGKKFDYVFPPYPYTILRLKAN